MKDQGDHDALVVPEILQDSDTGIRRKLPTPLRILYGLNGMTEAFPVLALTAMVNDRIEIPVSFLPAYFAVSFLPYSLKPLYAIAANAAKKRKRILVIALYLCSGLFFQITAFLKQGQVVICFLVAFLRGIFVSAAEFMIGLALLSSASSYVSSFSSISSQMSNRHDSFENHQFHEKLLSCYQSDAATCRNIGSLISQLLSFALIAMSRLVYQGKEDEGEGERTQHQLSDRLITAFFLISSFFPFVGAFIVAKYRMFGTTCDSEVFANNNKSCCYSKDTQHVGIFSIVKYDLIGLLTFQLLLLTIGVRSIIVENISNQTFVIISFMLGVALIISIVLSRSNQVFPTNSYSATNISNDRSSEKKRIEYMVQHLLYLKKVGFYLVLRHAVPSVDVMLSSYIYTIFRTKPLLLQSMSTLGSVVAVLSTWSYNKIVAEKFSSLDGIKRIIMLATTACCIWGMLAIPYIQSFRSLSKDDIFSGGTILLGTFTLFRLIGGFLSEISFMPSIVLATTTVIQDEAIHRNDDDDNDDDDHDAFEDDLCPNANSLEPDEYAAESSVSEPIDRGIQYGFLVSCIDFGDQMSTFISIPFIVFLGVTRENNWNNLEWFIFISSILGMLSLTCLRLLPL